MKERRGKIFKKGKKQTIKNTLLGDSLALSSEETYFLI